MIFAFNFVNSVTLLPSISKIIIKVNNYSLSRWLDPKNYFNSSNRIF